MDHTFSIGFYNLENLFEPREGYSGCERSQGLNRGHAWDEQKYRKKIQNLGKAISRIGLSESAGPPILMGVCEVETDRCLRDLVQSDGLRDHDYGFVHYKSADRRGLDTALLYQKKHFRVLASRPFSTMVNGRTGRETTRDILHVEGELFSEHLHILVNHWPSRLDGNRSTRRKRSEMARELKKVVDSICRTDPAAKIIVTGDFNDGPRAHSLKRDFDSNFINPLSVALERKGTAKYRKKWVVFDQILLNENLLNSKTLALREALVFDPPFLVQPHGRFRGAPKRTFAGRHYQGGFSDHFPVYALFDVQRSMLPKINTLSRS